MKKLFLFGMGGTGSRVIEALVYLLAAGVEITDSDGKPVELIPMLLDTDATNRDTLDCIAALDLYRFLNLHRFPSSRGGFFSTSVQPLASLAQDDSGDIAKTFRLNHKGVENATFRQFIDFDQISNPQIKNLIQVLYSDDNMNDKLTGGFLGNPNVGAVVLSGLKNTPDFSLFTTSFSPGDRIFIINSIFGGTGAAGLPWLQKALRSDLQATGAANAIRNAAMGALTVLPYFNLKDDQKSRIDSNAFIAKTKAALSYYYSHIDLNVLFYLADSSKATYANHESGEKQNNDAHVIELLGALAVLEFARIPDEECLKKHIYHECAIASDDEVLNFSSLGDHACKSVARRLTQMQMMAVLSSSHFKEATQQPWARKNGFDANFFNSRDYRDGFSRFMVDYFSVWIRQMANNRRAFAPFDLSVDQKDMSRLRTDKTLASGMFLVGLNGEKLDMAANKIPPLEGRNGNSLACFTQLWWQATDKTYRDLYQDYLD